MSGTNGLKPVAWAIFSENGNIRIWSPGNEAVERLAEREGLEVTPLVCPSASS